MIRSNRLTIASSSGIAGKIERNSPKPNMAKAKSYSGRADRRPPNKPNPGNSAGVVVVAQATSPNRTIQGAPQRGGHSASKAGPRRSDWCPFPAYAARLKEYPYQVDLLFRELLIGVTQFFRDPSAFGALATVVMPELLTRTEADDHLRIWVPACATGEEVYSIAILLREALIGRETSPSVQIFGTDIDENAIAFARSGRYRRCSKRLPSRRFLSPCRIRALRSPPWKAARGSWGPSRSPPTAGTAG